MLNGGGWVCYDGLCPHCTRLARFFAPVLATKGLRIVPLQTRWVAEHLNLPPGEPPREMVFMAPTGESFGGAAGVIAIARLFWWAAWLGWLGRTPFCMAGFDRAYRWIAARRNCANGACMVPDRRYRTVKVRDCSFAALIPFLAGAGTWNLPGWQFMWGVAAACAFALKWLVWRHEQPKGDLVRTVGWFCAWPGMDARKFFASCAQPVWGSAPAPGAVARALAGHTETLGQPHTFQSDHTLRNQPAWAPVDSARGGRAPQGQIPALVGARREWLFALLKMLFGVALVWICAPALMPHSVKAAAWTAMVGIIFCLHFGLFHLMSLAWRACGVNAQPIMRAPVLATSLSEFWGERWNTAFSIPARRLALIPLGRRIGIPTATFVVFFISGLLHEAVISLPARGGFGLPTAYFTLQALGMLFERSVFGRRLGLGRGWRGWFFVLLLTAGPACWLFHPPFVRNVILPMLEGIGAT